MRAQVTHENFHISSSFDYSWPYAWSVTVTQREVTKVTRTWVVWRAKGRWYGLLKGAQARFMKDMHGAEAHVNNAVKQQKP